MAYGKIFVISNGYDAIWFYILVLNTKNDLGDSLLRNASILKKVAAPIWSALLFTRTNITTNTKILHAMIKNAHFYIVPVWNSTDMQ